MECFHEQIAFSNTNFHCVNCGCVLPDKGPPPIVDPNYFTVIEISPIELFKDMKNSLEKVNQIRIVKNTEYLEERKFIMEWLFNACSKLNLSKRTSHLASLYTDLILNGNSNIFHSDKYYNIALCCLIIATKFIELDIKLPYFRDFIKISKTKIHRFIIQDTEICLLRLLYWNLRVPTVYEMVMNFLTAGVLFRDEHYQKEEVNRTHAKLISHYISLFSELIITEKEFLEYDFVTLACSIIYVARRASGIDEEWNKELVEITGKTMHDFQDCKEWIMIKFKDILEKSLLMNFDLISIFSDKKELNIVQPQYNSQISVSKSSFLINDPLIKIKTDPPIEIKNETKTVESENYVTETEKIENLLHIINDSSNKNKESNLSEDCSIIPHIEKPILSNVQLLSQRINQTSMIK